MSETWDVPCPEGRAGRQGGWPILERPVPWCRDSSSWGPGDRVKAEKHPFSQLWEMCRAAQRQSRDHDEDAQWGMGRPAPILQVGTLWFLGSQSSESDMGSRHSTRGSFQGLIRLDLAPVSTGLCDWCPLYASYPQSKLVWNMHDEERKSGLTMGYNQLE